MIVGLGARTYYFIIGMFLYKVDLWKHILALCWRKGMIKVGMMGIWDEIEIHI